MAVKSLNPQFDFLEFMDVASVLLDSSARVLKCNTKFDQLNASKNFFDISNSKMIYRSQASEWLACLQSCATQGGRQLSSSEDLIALTLTPMNLQAQDCILVQVFENNSAANENLKDEQIKELVGLTSSFAHEINNPLTVVAVRTQMLQQSLNDEGARTPEKLAQYLDKMNIQSERIKNLVSGMRSVTKNFANSVSADYAIKKIVEDAFVLATCGIKEKNVELKLENLSADFNFFCKPSDVMQIFLNVFKKSAANLAEVKQGCITVSFVEEQQSVSFFVSENSPVRSAGSQHSDMKGLKRASQLVRAYGGSCDAQNTHVHIKLFKSFKSAEEQAKLQLEPTLKRAS